MPSILPAVAEQLFRDVEKIYRETSQSKKNGTVALLSFGRSVKTVIFTFHLRTFFTFYNTNQSVISDLELYRVPVYLIHSCCISGFFKFSI